jgi:hypothetical protein
MTRIHEPTHHGHDAGGNQGVKLSIFNIRHSDFCTHFAPSCEAPFAVGVLPEASN